MWRNAPHAVLGQFMVGLRIWAIAQWLPTKELYDPLATLSIP
jgi:hypothetical protein